MTPPLLATRDALAAWFHRELGVDRCNRHDTNVRPACEKKADALLASGVVRDPATLADVQIRHQASMRPALRSRWWLWECETCGSSGSASEEGCRQAVKAHLRLTSTPMTERMARALAAALTEDPRG